MKSRLLKRDYNEELEEIAESKRFEKEAQNLLLSMLYKVDGAYNDYELVKRDVPYKDEFLQNILKNVKINCKEIKVAKPNSEENEIEKSKFQIPQETEQKLVFFPNEKAVLYNVIKSGIKKIDTNVSLENKAMYTAIQIGKCIGYSEVIRDFNGYSWSSVLKEIENIECNVIYTDLIYLLGEERLNVFDSKNINKLEGYIGKDLYQEIKKVAINFYLSNNEEQKEKLNTKLSQSNTRLNEMEDRETFIQNITDLKKQMISKVKDIDEQLNNQELLRKRYLEKNRSLPNEKKIFSVSHYEELIQNERNKILNDIEEYNKLLKPMEFVKIKTDLENELNYYKDLEKIDIVKMQNIFLSEFEKSLNKTNDKLDILNYIYKIRYLKYLPISKTEKMKDKIDFTEIEKQAILKGINSNLITPISNNENTDYELLKGIFNTRSVNLEELSIVLSVKDGKLEAKIYDGETLDNTQYIELPHNSNVQIRKTKKVKIFN